MDLRNIKLALFDLDGVITDTAKFHYLGWKKLAFELGIEIDEEFNNKLKGVSRDKSLELILEHGNKHISIEKFNACLELKNRYYLEYISGLSYVDILPGVVDTINELKSRNIKIVIASASKNAQFIIEKLGIIDLFDLIIDASLIKKSKPDPEIFNYGVKYFDVSPREAIGFEDSISGIEAIKSANIFAVGIGSVDELFAADIVVSNLLEFNIEG